MKKFWLFAVVAALAIGIASCGGGNGETVGGTIGTSSGKLLTPSGEPIAGAAVAVSSSSGASAITLKNAAGHPINTSKTYTDDESETCETLEIAGTTYGLDCTGSDGSYTIAYDVVVNCGDTVTFTAKKGAFFLQLNLTITCGDDTEGQDIAFDDFEFDDDCGISESSAVVAGKTIDYECLSGAGGIPNMAICEGDWDTLQDVLAKLGYGVIDETTGQWDGADSTADFDYFVSMTVDEAPNPEGNTRPSCCDLLKGSTIITANGESKTIDEYDIVFLNCGNGCDDPVADGALLFGGGYLVDAVLDATAQDKINEWVNAGGRFYVTDLSYDFVEQNFPDIIDFAGDGSDPAAKETPQAAQSGAGSITVYATVPEELSDYLALLPDLSDGTPILNADGTVTIMGFLGLWAQMFGLHTGSAGVIWAQGTVAGGVSDPQPLTVTSGVGDGEILYTSYHTEETSSVASGLGPYEMRPQEWILAFLVFAL